MADCCDVNEMLVEFRIRFPEFAAESDARILIYLNDALKIFSLCCTTVLYLAAHLLTLDNDSGAGGSGGSVDGGEGETVSESAGGVSASFKSQADTGKDSFYTVTPYGRRFLAMRNTCGAYKLSVRNG
jgi:hypothetical protein